MAVELRLGEPRVYLFEPVPAPRMTKAASYSDKPGVVKFRAFCAEVRRREIELPGAFRVEFFLAMPPSWTEAHRDHARGETHNVKPDLDNLVKALMDAVFYKRKGGDSHIWCVVASKRWSEAESHFIVTPILGGL